MTWMRRCLLASLASACLATAAVPSAAQTPCGHDWLSRIFRSLGLPCPTGAASIVRGTVAEREAGAVYFPSGTKLRTFDLEGRRETLLWSCTACSYPTPGPANRVYVLDDGRLWSVDAATRAATRGPAVPAVRALFAWNATERGLLVLTGAQGDASFAFRMLDPTTGALRAAPELDGAVAASDLLTVTRPVQHASSGVASWTPSRMPNLLIMRAAGEEQFRPLLPGDMLSRFHAAWLRPDRELVYVTRGD